MLQTLAYLLVFLSDVQQLCPLPLELLPCALQVFVGLYSESLRTLELCSLTEQLGTVVHHFAFEIRQFLGAHRLF